MKLCDACTKKVRRYEKLKKRRLRAAQFKVVSSQELLVGEWQSDARKRVLRPLKKRRRKQ